MKPQDEFVAARRPDWEELERLTAGRLHLHQLDGPSISRVVSLYRSVCADLTFSRSARYTSDLQTYLNLLTARVHGLLYGAKPFRWPAIRALVVKDFPAAVRRNWAFFALASALFLLPGVLGAAIGLLVPPLATKILPLATLEEMAHAYSKGLGGRELPTNTMMAGFYVYNNVGIAFRCFATGVFWGLGSMFFLVYNGLVTGATVGYVMHAGHGANIWTFMCGHGPFEITAILIAGTAGLRMGYALVDTHGRTRRASLRASAPDIVRLVSGAAMMLGIAALIEGYWSPSSVPPVVKWGASGVFSVAVASYFALAGRGASPRPPVRLPQGARTAR